MAEEEAVPSVAPVDPVAPTEPAPPEPSPIDRAKAMLEGQSSPAPTEAPPPPDPVTDTPTAADMVLGLAPAAAPEKEPAIPGDDPSLAKIVDMHQQALRQSTDLTERERAFQAQQAEAAALFEAQKILNAGGSKLDALKAMGLTYEELTAEALKGPGAQLEPMAKQLTELQAELAGVEAAAEKRIADALAERDRKIEEQNRAIWDRDTAARVASDPERWELVNDPVAQSLIGQPVHKAIYAVMEAHFESTGGEANGGEVLTVDRATDMLEASLEKRLRVSNGSASKKLASLLGISVSNTPNTGPASSHAESSAPNTSAAPELSTRLSAQASDAPPAQRMTADDYRRRATELAERQASGQ